MKNEIISKFLFENELKQWQAADLLGMRADSLSRKMRYEIPVEEQKQIVARIKEAQEGGNHGAGKA